MGFPNKEEKGFMVKVLLHCGEPGWAGGEQEWNLKAVARETLAWLRGNPKSCLPPEKEQLGKGPLEGGCSQSMHHTLQGTVVRMWERQDRGPRNTPWQRASFWTLFQNDTLMCNNSHGGTPCYVPPCWLCRGVDSPWGLGLLGARWRQSQDHVFTAGSLFLPGLTGKKDNIEVLNRREMDVWFRMG